MSFIFSNFAARIAKIYMNLIWITSAKYLGDYRLELTFNDGTIKIFDGKDIVLKPLYQSLQSLVVFQQFELDGWTISWENGKIDIAPEYLYEHAIAAYYYQC